MTAEEFFDEEFCDACSGVTKITNEMLISKSYILEAMQQYARLCCDKQKQICVNEAQCGSGWEGSASWVDTDSILNSPYPEELL